jgi:hypothetical protein
MSNINTGSIVGSYPSPGVNNSSQGFRDNFTSIKNNLDTAATEITDLQSKVLVKSALSGTSMDNDMNNGIIANVQTLSFRASTYNLGTNLSGTVTVDCTLGDVQYGTMDGNSIVPLNLQFSKWAPSGTRGVIDVIIDIAGGKQIILPDSVSIGLDTIEGLDSSATYPLITIPSGVTKVHYQFASVDCGTTVEIVPVDRPRQTTQIKYANFIFTGGNIDLTNGSTTVTLNTATNTTYAAFTSDLTNTKLILKSSNVIIGSGTFIDSTTFTLLSPYSGTTVTDVEFIYESFRGAAGDVVGDVRTDGTALYVCNTVFSTSSTSNIWTTVSGGGSSSFSGDYDNSNVIALLNSNSSSVLDIKTTRNISAGQNATITGTLTANNIIASTLLTVTTANVTTVNATGNVLAANITANTKLTTTALDATGNVSFTGNVTLGTVANVHITGGSANQYLMTNGLGGLSWETVSSNGGGSGTVSSGAANQIAFYSGAGTTVGQTGANLTWTNGNTLTVVGNANATIFNGTTGAITTINSTTVSTASLTATGNVALSGANVSLGNVSNLRITGGSNGQMLTTNGVGGLSWTSASYADSNVISLLETSGRSNNIITSGTGDFGAITTRTATVSGNLTSGNVSASKANVNTMGVAGQLTTNVINSNVAIINGNATVNGTLTANAIVTNGSGPVTVTSTSSIQLTTGSGSQVITSSGLKVGGNIFTTPITSGTPVGTTGTAGQIVIDIGNSKIWVCTVSGSPGTWKSATLS